MAPPELYKVKGLVGSKRETCRLDKPGISSKNAVLPGLRRRVARHDAENAVGAQSANASGTCFGKVNGSVGRDDDVFGTLRARDDRHDGVQTVETLEALLGAVPLVKNASLRVVRVEVVE